MAEPAFGDQAFGQTSDWIERPKKSSGEWGCMKTCGVGCLVVVIVLAIGAFIIYKNSKFGNSENPADVAALVKETLGADIPAGYDGKMSFNMSVFSYGMRMMIMAPQGVKINKKDDDDEEHKHTVLFVFAFYGVDDEALKKGFNEQRGKPKAKADGPEEKTTLKVGNREVPATKVETSQNGVKSVQYQAVVKPGVLFMAMGPADKFDKKAMEAFLASVKD